MIGDRSTGKKKKETRRVQITSEAEDLSFIEAESEKAGVSVSEYYRQLVSNARGAPPAVVQPGRPGEGKGRVKNKWDPDYTIDYSTFRVSEVPEEPIQWGDGLFKGKVRAAIETTGWIRLFVPDGTRHAFYSFGSLTPAIREYQYIRREIRRVMQELGYEPSALSREIPWHTIRPDPENVGELQFGENWFGIPRVLPKRALAKYLMTLQWKARSIMTAHRAWGEGAGVIGRFWCEDLWSLARRRPAAPVTPEALVCQSGRHKGVELDRHNGSPRRPGVLYTDHEKQGMRGFPWNDPGFHPVMEQWEDEEWRLRTSYPERKDTGVPDKAYWETWWEQAQRRPESNEAEWMG